MDYSEKISFPSTSVTPPVLAMGIDAQGVIYLLGNGQPASMASCYITKLSPAGDQIVYQKQLSFQAAAMAVDASGKVYLAGPNFVEKLDTDGQTVIYTATISPRAVLAAIAVDGAGRPYVTGYSNSADLAVSQGALQPQPFEAGSNGLVARLTATGAIDYATYFGSQPVAIAVDAAGSAFVTGYGRVP